MGHPHILSILARAGADLNLPRNDGWRPLTIACAQRRHNAALALVAEGCDVDILTPTSEVPLSMATKRNWPDLVRALLARGAAPNVHKTDSIPLCLAARHVYVPGGVLDLLLEAGADPNARTRDGTTSVFVAAQDGHWRVLERLIAAGADVNSRRVFDGVNAVFMASYVPRCAGWCCVVRGVAAH